VELKQASIVRVTTTPGAFIHIIRQLQFFKESQIDLKLICSSGDFQKNVKEQTKCEITTIEIPRGINIFRDLIAVLKLYIHFIKTKPTIVHSSTPKAGLLCAIATFFAGVPIRLHTFTGQRWATLSKGSPLRLMLIFFDKLIVKLNTYVYTDSPTQAKFLIENHIVKESGVSTIHKGCYGGIDFERFDLQKLNHYKKIVRDEIKIDNDTKLVLFLGRITKDKGIEDLLEVFSDSEFQKRNIHLILVGPFEQELDPISNNALEILKNNKQVHYLGYTDTPEKYFVAADLLCMPSYREGFGTVILEAASLKVPAIGSDIPGLKDAIVDGETGLLFPLKNQAELKRQLLHLCEDNNLRLKLGEKAYSRAKIDFSYQILAKKQVEEYTRLLKQI
jgi:glycosyltransferase involved in cell wall biosynthesis